MGGKDFIRYVWTRPKFGPIPFRFKAKPYCGQEYISATFHLNITQIDLYTRY